MHKLREAPVLLEIFLVSNFAFLTVDIYIAHSINRFRHGAEWIPFWFSLIATVARRTEPERLPLSPSRPPILPPRISREGEKCTFNLMPTVTHILLNPAKILQKNELYC